MGTNISKLKHGKGSPPSADKVHNVISDNSRSGSMMVRPLQVRIPIDVFEDFSEQAGREFGFSHGSKKRLFLKIWEAYKAQCM